MAELVVLFCPGICLHCKKRLAIFASSAGMPLTKLSLAGNNLIMPGQEGKSLTFFYSLGTNQSFEDGIQGVQVVKIFEKVLSFTR